MTTPYEFRQSEPPTPGYWRWLGLLLFAAAIIWGSTRALGQSPGDPKWFFKGAAVGDQTGYVAKANNTLYAINGSGNFALLAQSNFANASHTHPASAITDFNSLGDARWSLLGHTHAASDITSGVFNHARLGTGGGGSSKFLREDGTWQTVSTGGGTWGSITGTLSAQTDLQTELDNINSALSIYGADYLSRATGSQFSALPNGTKATPTTSDMGVLEDVAASSVKKGFTLGSLPISTAAQTALDLKAPLASPTFTGTVSGITKSMVGLGNVENTALSTWAGSANITTLGTIATGTVPAANVSGLGSLALLDDGATLSAGLSFPPGGMKLLDPDLSNVLDIRPVEITTDQRLTIDLSDADRLLTLTNDATIEGTNTGDQSESSIEALVDLQDLQGAVTDAQVPDNITITNLSGTNTGDQTITLTGDVTGSGTGSFATTVAETELAALASTTSAANKVPYYTGSGTASTTDLKMGTETAYTGSITWTAGAAPSSTANLRQFYTQVGNHVTWQISLTYANTGTTVTNVSLTFPTQFPTPAIPTGFTGASVRLWNCDNARLLTTPSGSLANGTGFFIMRNAADTGFEISSTAAFTSGSYRTFIFSGTYFTQ